MQNVKRGGTCCPILGRPARPNRGPKAKGRQTGQTRHRCPRGQQGSQGPGPAEAAGRRFVERTHESHGLVGAFCAWLPERNCCQADGAQARVREERGRGAPLLRPRVNLHRAALTRSRRGGARRPFSVRFQSRTRGTFAAASFLSHYRKRLGGPETSIGQKAASC